MAKTVNQEFQVFKCICITMICIGHTHVYGFNGPFDLFSPYSFHVAAFAFIAGYFYKAANDGHPLAFIRKKVTRLLVPTLLINVLYGMLACYLHQVGFEWTSSPYFHYELNAETLLVLPFISGHQFNLNYAMWFVPALVMAESAFVLLRATLSRILRRGALEWAAALPCVVAGVAAVVIGGQKGLPVGWQVMVGRACFLLSFVAIGRAFRRRVEPSLPSDLTGLILGVCALELLLTYVGGGELRYVPSWLRFPNNVVVTYAATLCGICFWLCIAKLLAPALGRTRIVNAIADSTFPIMMHHRLWMFLVCGCLGLLSVHTQLFPTFSWEKYHTREFYHFMPEDYRQFGFLYIFVCMAAPVVAHMIWLRLKAAVSPRPKRKAAPKHGAA